MVCKYKRYCGGFFPLCVSCEGIEIKEKRIRDEQEKNEKIRAAKKEKKEIEEREAQEALANKGVTFVQRLK